MALIPRLEPSVGISGTPTPRATGLGPEAFGAGLGQGMTQAAKDVQGVALVEFEKEKAATLASAKVDYLNQSKGVLYGQQNADGSVTPGLTQIEGEGAKGLELQYKPKHDEAVTKIKTNLSKFPDAAQLFESWAGEQYVNNSTQLHKHEIKERQKVTIDKNEALVKASYDTILNRYRAGEEVDLDNPDLLNGIKTIAAVQGWPKEATDQKIREYQSNLVTDMINGHLAEKDLAGAKGLYSQFGDILTAHNKEVHTKMGAAIQNETDYQVSEGRAKEVFASMGPKSPDDVLDIEGMRKAIREDGYSNRPDGTKKGNGWLGPIKRPDGSVSTEISVGVDVNGKYMDIPTMVPGLTKEELDYLINTPVDDPNYLRGPLSDKIIDKAVAHAEKMIAQGKSPFAENPAEDTGLSRDQKELAEKKVEEYAREYDGQKRQNQEALSNQINKGFQQKQSYTDLRRQVEKGNVDSAAKGHLYDWLDHKFKIGEAAAEAKSEAKQARAIQQLSNLLTFQNKYINGDYGNLSPAEVAVKFAPQFGAFTDNAMQFVNGVGKDLGMAKLDNGEFKGLVRVMRENKLYKDLLPNPEAKDDKEQAKMALLQSSVTEILAASNTAPGKKISVREATLKAIEAYKTDSGTFFNTVEPAYVLGTDFATSYGNNPAKWPRATQDKYIAQKWAKRNPGKQIPFAELDRLRAELIKGQ